ncbi:hypothetical protein H4219_004510 [Mycoemilia scoparia]|uniref:Uncharacterized protein n=1 Tax=Mycoemilia scoparia TaxID=417184 RepID=A0A9W7ZS70_9FUNG|nr:hypothetical protein H4219_004510 [Mycoemilia scoparia]
MSDTEEPMEYPEDYGVEEENQEVIEAEQFPDGKDAGEKPKDANNNNTEKMTTPFLTNMNAPVMVELDGETDPFEIAQKELREKKIPFTIRRYLPDGSYEDWKVQDLITD